MALMPQVQPALASSAGAAFFGSSFSEMAYHLDSLRSYWPGWQAV
jgi:hypothetical protein